MSKFVEFESVDGNKVAINPRAVTMVSSHRVATDIVYITTSNGEEVVHGEFSNVIAKLSAADEIIKKTVLKENLNNSDKEK